MRSGFEQRKKTCIQAIASKRSGVIMTYESKMPKDVGKGRPESVNGDVDSR
jgi:hypothetical protein